MQRLFSSFADGAPGAGLLLLRLSASASLLLHALGTFGSQPAGVSAGFSLLGFATSALMLLGLWTPAVGVLVAIAAGWHGLATPSELGLDALLGTLGIALALLGPGAWSVDAHLFGRRRLHIGNRTGADASSSSGEDESSSI